MYRQREISHEANRQRQLTATTPKRQEMQLIRFICVCNIPRVFVRSQLGEGLACQSGLFEEDWPRSALIRPTLFKSLGLTYILHLIYQIGRGIWSHSNTCLASNLFDWISCNDCVERLYHLYQKIVPKDKLTADEQKDHLRM